MSMKESDMRTTLTIDDDVLAVAKELAATQKKSVGEVIYFLPGEHCVQLIRT